MFAKTHFILAIISKIRCLKKVGGKYIFFPISINYEQIPEHSVLSQEANGKMRRPFRILSLLRWLKVSHIYPWNNFFQKYTP